MANLEMLTYITPAIGKISKLILHIKILELKYPTLILIKPVSSTQTLIIKYSMPKWASQTILKIT